VEGVGGVSCGFFFETEDDEAFDGVWEDDDAIAVGVEEGGCLYAS
jgi:hypothetical protein